VIRVELNPRDPEREEWKPRAESNRDREQREAQSGPIEVGGQPDRTKMGMGRHGSSDCPLADR